MSSLVEIAEGLAATLAPIGDEIDNLQIVAAMVPEPTPPCLDVYPADPFMAESTMGPDPSQAWTVRARATTADNEAGQRLLLRFMDLEDAASVTQALLDDTTLDGTVGEISVGWPSGFQAYADPGGQGFLIGCTWRVEVYP